MSKATVEDTIFCELSRSLQQWRGMVIPSDVIPEPGSPMIEGILIRIIMDFL